MNIDNDTIRKFQAQCRAFARNRKYPQEADDFAQDAAIAFIRGRRATIEQLFIDYLRQRYGSTRNRSHRPGSGAPGRDVCIHEPQGPMGGLSLLDTLPANGTDPRPEPCDWRSLVSLGWREEVIFELHYEHDVLMGDIGQMMGVTESRICQVLSTVRKEIKAAFVKQDRYDEYKDDRQASILEVNWITL